MNRMPPPASCCTLTWNSSLIAYPTHPSDAPSRAIRHAPPEPTTNTPGVPSASGTISSIRLSSGFSKSRVFETRFDCPYARPAPPAAGGGGSGKLPTLTTPTERCNSDQLARRRDAEVGSVRSGARGARRQPRASLLLFGGATKRPGTSGRGPRACAHGRGREPRSVSQELTLVHGITGGDRLWWCAARCRARPRAAARGRRQRKSANRRCGDERRCVRASVARCRP